MILNVLPYTPYLAILGSTYGGRIEAVGERVEGWKVGERVVVSKRFGVKGNEKGAFQRYVVCGDRMVSNSCSLLPGHCVAGMKFDGTEWTFHRSAKFQTESTSPSQQA